MFVAFMATYGVFYLYPNMFAAWEPHMLPLLAIDRNVPFLPWTFFIYCSDYTIFIFVIFLHRTKEGFNSMARMCFATLITCGAFFVLFPTTYPRPEYPTDVHFAVRFLMDLITMADSPRNCFPSMHVALTGVATWSLYRHNPKAFPFYVVWSVLIFVSTLTTKQHYLVDVLGGIGVIFFVALLEKYLFAQVSIRLPSGLFPR